VNTLRCSALTGNAAPSSLAYTKLPHYLADTPLAQYTTFRFSAPSRLAARAAPSALVTAVALVRFLRGLLLRAAPSALVTAVALVRFLRRLLLRAAPSALVTAVALVRFLAV